MALKIRMARGGSKKRPVYRVVVTDSRNPRDGKFIEKLGMHDPLLSNDHPQRFAVNEERVRYWLSVGAQSSDRVNRYLAKLGIEKAQERFEQTKKNQPKKKAQERIAVDIKKQQAAAELAAQPQAEPEVLVEEAVIDVVAEEAPVVQAEDVITEVEADVVSEEAPAVTETSEEESTPDASEEPSA